MIVHLSTLHHQSNLYVIKKNWFDLIGCMDYTQLELGSNLCSFVLCFPYSVLTGLTQLPLWLRAFETSKGIQTTGRHWKWWNTSAEERRTFFILAKWHTCFVLAVNHHSSLLLSTYPAPNSYILQVVEVMFYWFIFPRFELKPNLWYSLLTLN